LFGNEYCDGSALRNFRIKWAERFFLFTGEKCARGRQRSTEEDQAERLAITVLQNPSPPIDASALHLVTADDGRCILVDLQGDRIIALNAVGAEMWLRLSEKEEWNKIVEDMSSKYGVDPGRVREDLDALVLRISELRLSPEKSVGVRQPNVDSGQGSQIYPWYASPADDRPHAPISSVILAFFGLLAFDIILSMSSLKTVWRLVNSWTLRTQRSSPTELPGRVCGAVEKAAVWYPRRAMCLQRSAVTTCILRCYGIQAKMVIGIRPLPFMAHAWVEVDGCVLNDWRGVAKFYSPLVAG
jgi:hypothetical protein